MTSASASSSSKLGRCADRAARRSAERDGLHRCRRRRARAPRSARGPPRARARSRSGSRSRRRQLEQAHEFRYMVRNDDLGARDERACRHSSSAKLRVQVPWRGHDLSTPRRPPRTGRWFPLRARCSSQPSGPPDQQLPPPARRRHRLRGSAAPLIESRSKNYLTMAMEEVASGKIPGAQLAPSSWRHWRVARILLSVTGGIAAYKACSSSAFSFGPATTSVRCSPPEPSGFVTAETFSALARSRSQPTIRTRISGADVLVVAPLTANTLARLAHGLADDVLTEAALAHRRAGARRAGDEQPHVGESRDAGQRRDAPRSRHRDSRAGRAASSRRAKKDSGRMVGARRDLRANRADSRRRRAALSPGNAFSSPRAERASRSTRCATSATARRGAWGRARRGGAASRGRRHPPRREPLPCRRRVGVNVVDTPTAADLEREASSRGELPT